MHLSTSVLVLSMTLFIAIVIVLVLARADSNMDIRASQCFQKLPQHKSALEKTVALDESTNMLQRFLLDQSFQVSTIRQSLWPLPTPLRQPRGIILVLTDRSMLEKIQTTIHDIRGHGCDLPIELWYEAGTVFQGEVTGVDWRRFDDYTRVPRGRIAPFLATLFSSFDRLLYVDSTQFSVGVDLTAHFESADDSVFWFDQTRPFSPFALAYSAVRWNPNQKSRPQCEQDPRLILTTVDPPRAVAVWAAIQTIQNNLDELLFPTGVGLWHYFWTAYDLPFAFQPLSIK